MFEGNVYPHPVPRYRRKTGLPRMYGAVDPHESRQFDRNGAHTLDEIAAIVGEGRLSEILVPVDEMFAALRFATADDHAKSLRKTEIR